MFKNTWSCVMDHCIVIILHLLIKTECCKKYKLRLPNLLRSQIVY